MLNVIEPEKALELILGCAGVYNQDEKTDIRRALGRVISEDVFAEADVPGFTRSTVDGFAVKAADTYGASEALPAILLKKGSIAMGENTKRNILSGECFAIPTGGKLPEGADCVVMLEHTEDIGDEFCYIQRSAAVLENVTRKGEDIEKGSCVIRAGTVVKPSHIGICASLGITSVKIKKQPVIGIISTGDELVEIEKEPLCSQIRDTNTHLLSAIVEESYCISKEYPIVRDNEEELLCAAKLAAEECDAVIVSGGSSAGEKDSVFNVLNTLGDVLFHGLAMKPGKPAMFAVVNGKCVFGLPGHPAAAYFVCLRLVRPALYNMLGVRCRERCVTAVTDRNIPADSGRQELVPVKLTGGEGMLTAQALYMKSGVVSVLSNADGYIIVERNTEGIGKGEKVTVHML